MGDGPFILVTEHKRIVRDAVDSAVLQANFRRGEQSVYTALLAGTTGMLVGFFVLAFAVWVVQR